MYINRNQPMILYVNIIYKCIIKYVYYNRIYVNIKYI